MVMLQNALGDEGPCRETEGGGGSLGEPRCHPEEAIWEGDPLAPVAPRGKETNHPAEPFLNF